MRKICVRERENEKERMNERNMGEDEQKTSQKERREGGERERQRNIVNDILCICCTRRELSPLD